MDLPYLRHAGGVLLVYVAIKLWAQNGIHQRKIASAENLWDAVKLVAIADIAMSLDNVLAIAAAAQGHPALIVFGLVMSIPLIIAGATVIMTVLARLPILV
jgi:YjbE family integral membrane protein